MNNSSTRFFVFKKGFGFGADLTSKALGQHRDCLIPLLGLEVTITKSIRISKFKIQDETHNLH